MNEIDEEQTSTENSESNPQENIVSEPEASADGEDAGSKDKESGEPKKPFSEILDWISCMVFAVAIMLVLNLFLFRSITVSGPSMNDTLLDGDKIISTNFFYTPDYGDVIIVQASKLVNKETGLYGEPIVKRVIALAGDTVRIDFTEGKVYRNGEAIEEEYIKELTHLRNSGWMENNVSYIVPENCVFVMGDNRNVSNDSRNLSDVGFIDTDYIMGKAIFRFSPIKTFKFL